MKDDENIFDVKEILRENVCVAHIKDMEEEWKVSQRRKFDFIVRVWTSNLSDNTNIQSVWKIVWNANLEF